MVSSREGVLPSPAALGSIAVSLLLLAGCGGGEGIILPGDGEPAAIAVVEGDAQRGRVGEPLNEPLVVQVTDARGRAVRGATVAFDFTTAGAGAAVVPEQKTTNADGLADARLVLGTTRGQQTGQARVVVPEGREPIQAGFSAMALPENANSMAAVAGQDQTGHIGQPLDDRLVVEVTDGFGNPVAGVPISWAAAGGGSVSEAVVETDEDGRSRVDRTLGPSVGQQTTLASSEGLAGSPVIFVHTALSGDASRLVIISGNDQTAEAGSVLPGELVVRLVDSEGNGVPNTALTWVMATGGGSPSPQNTTTDADGRTSTRWTLGGALGEQRLDAVVSGVGIASFRATATAGAPASLFIRTQPSASASNGTPLARQPVIQLRDAGGNDVAQAGVLVSAAIGSGGGELGGTRQVSTDASGRATFTDLSIAGGPGPRTLIFTASGYAQVTSSEIALEAIGTSTTITGDSPDPSGVGAAFTVSFTVSSQGPTPTGSVTVSDGVQSCTGSLAGGAGSCQLALATAGGRTLTATYSGAPGLTGSSDTETHTVSAAPPPPPATTTTTITADDPDPSVTGSTFTVSFQVSSGGGTPTGNVTVTASSGNSSCTGNLSRGIGSCQLSLNTVGDRTLTATYHGGPGFSPSTGTASHTVTRQNEAPNADFNWQCEDLTCFFTDRSDDDDGTIVGRHWDWGDGTSTDNEVNPSHTYAAPGNYRVILTVTDNGGLTDQHSDDVDPAAPPPPNQPPTAEFTFQCDELACAFDDQTGDSDGTVEDWSWTFGDGGTSGERNPDHDYSSSGTYQVTLTVRDNDGAETSVTHSVSVAEAPPPNQNPTAAFTESCVGLTCSFNSGGSGDPDGTIVGYSWTFGDGATSNEPNPSHPYPGTGSYTVTLKVTDDDNATDDASHGVSVTAPPQNQPPNAVDDTYSTPGGGQALIVGAPQGVLSNDTDPEGTELSAQNPVGQALGAVALSNDGSFTYTPDPGATGQDSFTYEASDGSLTTFATVTITVTP